MGKILSKGFAAMSKAGAKAGWGLRARAERGNMAIAWATYGSLGV